MMSLSCMGGGLLFLPLHGKTNRIAYGQTHNRGTAADRAGTAGCASAEKIGLSIR